MLDGWTLACSGYCCGLPGSIHRDRVYNMGKGEEGRVAV